MRNELDEETIGLLLRYGIFFSEKAPAVSKEQALVFVAEAMLEDFVEEFRGVLDKLHPDCRLKDVQATPEEMKAWFGEDWKPANAEPPTSSRGSWQPAETRCTREDLCQREGAHDCRRRRLADNPL